MMKQPDVVLYSRTQDGHRGAYIAFISSLMSAECRNARDLLRSRQPVFFLLIEDSFAFYVLTAVLRAMIGRRTVGLLFRPKPALDGNSLRLRLKRLVLYALKTLSPCTTLTILPFSVDPRFARIADGWIYDFQLWDLPRNDRQQVANRRGAQFWSGRSELFGQIVKIANGRTTVCAVGRQDKDKGFDTFVKIFTNNSDIRDRVLFAFGGKVSEDLLNEATKFSDAGGVCLSRRMDDQEILDLYTASDLVWCYYAENYDQASGILGRAAQLGIPAIVRRGSLIHALCSSEGILHLPLDADKPDALLRVDVAVDPPRGNALAEIFADKSLETLRQALGIISNEMPAK